MPRNRKNAASMQVFLSEGKQDTDLIGFAKTLKNNPSQNGAPASKLKVSANRNVNAVPYFDQKYYEAYDIVVAFPLSFSTVPNFKTAMGLAPNGASIVPEAKKKKILMSILKGRKSGRRMDSIEALKDFYNVTESTIQGDITYNQLLGIVREAFKATLQYGNFVFTVSTSADGKNEIYRLKMSEDALKKIADLKNYPLQMDPVVTQFQQFRDDPNFTAPYSPFEKKYEKTEREGSAMQTIGHIWQRYDRLSRPYKDTDFSRNDKELSIFRDTDRIRLTSAFFDGFFSLHWAKKHHFVSNFYACHQPTALCALRSEWGSFTKIWTWSQPLDAIRDYYGEETAFYYAWLGQFCEALTVPAFFGLVLYITELVLDWNLNYENTIVNSLRMIYCVLLAGWSTYFYQRWCRKEKDLRMRWGLDVVTGNKTSPQANPWHKPNCMVADPVAPHKRVQGTTTAQIIGRRTFTTIVAALVTVFCLVVTNREATAVFAKLINLVGEEALSFDKWVALKVSEIVNPEVQEFINKNIYLLFLPLVALVKIVTKLWDKVIIQKLAKFENNPLYTSYKDSMTEKSFVFKFLIHLVPVIYLAFLKEKIETCEDLADGRCILETRKLIATIVTVGFTSNLIEIATPMIKHAIKIFKRKKSVGDKVVAFHEHQLTFAAYSETNNMKDFQEMMLVYAFISLFASCFPILPVYAFIVTLIEIRSDAFKLTRGYQRVWPNYVEDSGIWAPIMNTISIGAVITNTLLVGLVTVGYHMEPVFKLGFSLAALICVLCFKEFIAVQIPKESKKYKTQRARSHVVMFEAIWGHQHAAKKEAPVGI